MFFKHRQKFNNEVLQESTKSLMDMLKGSEKGISLGQHAGNKIVVELLERIFKEIDDLKNK